MNFFRLVLCCWFFPSQWLRITHKKRNKSTSGGFYTENAFGDGSKHRCTCYCVKTRWKILPGPASSAGYFYFPAFWMPYIVAVYVPAALGIFGQQHVPRGSTAARGAGWVRGGQAVVCACSPLGCSVGCLSAWNCTAITYLWFHRSPARAAVWELAKIQADSHCKRASHM